MISFLALVSGDHIVHSRTGYTILSSLRSRADEAEGHASPSGGIEREGTEGLKLSICEAPLSQSGIRDACTNTQKTAFHPHLQVHGT
jgi:hypothetical protein